MAKRQSFGQAMIEKALIVALERGTVKAFLESLNSSYVDSGWLAVEEEGLIPVEPSREIAAQHIAQFPLFQRALLAAAAPALLAALQDLLDALAAHSFPGTDVADKVREAQEAVRLATGSDGAKDTGQAFKDAFEGHSTRAFDGFDAFTPEQLAQVPEIFDSILKEMLDDELYQIIIKRQYLWMNAMRCWDGNPSTAPSYTRAQYLADEALQKEAISRGLNINDWWACLGEWEEPKEKGDA